MAGRDTRGGRDIPADPDLVNVYEHQDALRPGHVAVSTTADGQIYGGPFYVDASSLFWNKDLYRQAGLDPEKGPTTWAEVPEHARAIRALGGDIYGFYFPGSCSGCHEYTFLPQIRAAGGDVIDYSKHTVAHLTGDADLSAKASRWIEAILASSGPDGQFGPRSNDDWWPRMVALKALTQHHDATRDDRVLDVMGRYLRFHAANAAERPGTT